MIDDEKPRRRAGKGALAMTPGLLMRAVMYSPKDFAAGFIAFAAICAIVGNAIFMQAGRHPSPMFGTPSFSTATVPMIPNPLPRPRPIEAMPSDKPLDSRLFDNRPAETKAPPQKPEAAPAPRVEIRAEPKPESRVEARPERAEARNADPMASLIRNAAVSRPAAPPAPAANPNIPRPPASVPMQGRGDPLGDFISGRGR